MFCDSLYRHIHYCLAAVKYIVILAALEDINCGERDLMWRSQLMIAEEELLHTEHTLDLDLILQDIL